MTEQTYSLCMQTTADGKASTTVISKGMDEETAIDALFGTFDVMFDEGKYRLLPINPRSPHGSFSYRAEDGSTVKYFLQPENALKENLKQAGLI